jgi:hypothetical protein
MKETIGIGFAILMLLSLGFVALQVFVWLFTKAWWIVDRIAG